MNCDCIKTIERKMLEKDSSVRHQMEEKGKTLIKAEISGQKLVVSDDCLRLLLSYPLSLTVKENKRPLKMTLFVSYCPFCGKSVGQMDNNKEAK